MQHVRTAQVPAGLVAGQCSNVRAELEMFGHSPGFGLNQVGSSYTALQFI